MWPAAARRADTHVLCPVISSHGSSCPTVPGGSPEHDTGAHGLGTLQAQASGTTHSSDADVFCVTLSQGLLFYSCQLWFPGQGAFRPSAGV